MKINNLIPIYFDLESTGLSGFDDQFISAVTIFNESENNDSFTSLESLATKFNDLRSTVSNFLLVTFNGENYYQGFDIPFLRSQCIKHNIDWKLKGIRHLDIYPLVKKFISTNHYIKDIPSKSSLYKDDLVKLSKANNFEYTNKNDSYNSLIELGEKCNWLDYIKEECKEKNDLQTIYQLIYDREAKEEYISGEEVPKLFEAKDIESILKHNVNDVIRLRKVTEAIINTIPDYELKRNINTL